MGASKEGARCASSPGAGMDTTRTRGADAPPAGSGSLRGDSYCCTFQCHLLKSLNPPPQGFLFRTLQPALTHAVAASAMHASSQ